MGKCSVIFAGGKTGGHLFPGVAVAERIEEEFRNVEVVFVGVKGGLEEKVIPKKGWKVEFIPMTTPRVGGLKGIFKFFFYSFPASFVKSFIIITRYRPSLLVGLGGYSAFPVIFTGWILGIKRVILEQNVLMGVTNKTLSLIANKVFLPFPIEKGRKYVVSGNPVRKLVLSDKKEGKFVVGVLGGSQGARGLNKLIEKSLPYLVDIKEKVKFIHQVGKQPAKDIKELYKKYGFEADVIEFIEDMGWFYGNVDLLISRAGATTIAELLSIGKGAIFVPFPAAADDHQRKNAQYLQDKGAGVLFDESGDPEELASIIKDFINHPEKLQEMNQNANSLCKGDATERIVKEIKPYLEKACLAG